MSISGSFQDFAQPGEIQRLLAEFAITADALDVPGWPTCLEAEVLKAPHRAPGLRPGFGAVYVFALSAAATSDAGAGRVLKVGRVGANSNARFQFQHYSPTAARSTLAGSLIKYEILWPWLGVDHLDAQNVRRWMLEHLDRVNVYTPTTTSKITNPNQNRSRNCPVDPGSGNLTIGGWHANDEILTVVTASREHGVPDLVARVVEFLRQLPTSVPISPLAASGIKRTADQLDGLIAASPTLPTGRAFVESVQDRILDQLPPGPAGVLELIAPYHVPGGRALGALLDRYQPAVVTLLVQPQQTVMEPEALQRAADSRSCEQRFVQRVGDEKSGLRYRHGKVITALVDDVPVWTLTGSLNLTAAALLHPVPLGNCEIGLVSPAGESLLPQPFLAVTDPPVCNWRSLLAPMRRRSSTPPPLDCLRQSPSTTAS